MSRDKRQPRRDDAQTITDEFPPAESVTVQPLQLAVGEVVEVDYEPIPTTYSIGPNGRRRYTKH